MKKKVRVQVINADWEIKKTRMRQNVKDFVDKAKPVIKEGGKCLLLGVGIGITVIINENL